MAESYVRVPADDVGKKLRTRLNTIGADDVHSEVFVLEDGSGNLLIPLSEAGTVNVSSGTLQTVTQIGTLPNVIVGSGTLQAISSPVTVASGTVAISNGTLTGANPSDGTLTQLGTLYYVDTVKQIGTLPNINVASGTIEVSSMPTTTVQWSNQAVGVTDGTLRTVTEIGTLPNVIVGSGTLQAISSPVTVASGTVQISGGTVTGNNPSAGTLDVLTRIGTLPNLIIESGTLQQVTNCYLAGAGTVVIGSGTVTTSLSLTEGTLNTVTQIGTLPNITVGSGTLQAISSPITVASGTIAISSGTLTGSNPSAGTLDIITQVGTLPNIIIGSGTVQEITNCYLAGAGTVVVGSGTVTTSMSLTQGTLDVVTQIGTLPNVIVGSGTLQAISGNLNTVMQSGTLQQVTLVPDVGNIGTLPDINIASGTINIASMPTTTVQWSNQIVGVSDGTLTSLPNVIIGSGTIQTINNGTISNIGTLPNITVGSGTLQQVTAVSAVTSITNPVTVTWGLGTANPTAGTLDTVTRIGTLPDVIVASGTLQAISGNVNTIPQSGTLQQITLVPTVTQIGTLPNIVIGSGTLQAISGAVTLGGLGTVLIGGGTLTGSNPSAGTLDTITQIGTLPPVGGTVGIADGTLTTITQIGTLPNVVIGSGTLQSISGNVNVVVQSGTIQTLNNGTLSSIGTLPNIVVGSGTLQAITGNVPVIAQSGTLQQVTLTTTVGAIGTLPNIVVGSGTLQAISSNVNVVPVGSGTVRVAAGTVILGANNGVDIGNIDVASGTLLARNQVRLAGAPGAFADVGLGTYTPMPVLGTVQMVSAGTINNVGTVYYQPNLGTLYAVTGNVKTIPQSGTLQTVTALGSANVYAKHDLIVYDSAGTLCTGQGSIVQTASKIIKVHHYKAQADGTFAFHFAATKPNGGTLDPGWYFLQREGVVSPFIPYPGYLFKTTTAGSALCIGTWPSIPCNGTLRLTMIYTDDDTA